MGSEEDPKDGSAVAGAVFGAVFVYIVRDQNSAGRVALLTSSTGLLRILWIPSLPPSPREPPWRDNAIMISDIYGGIVG